MWSVVNDLLPIQETVLHAKQFILAIIYEQNIFCPSRIVSESSDINDNTETEKHF